MHKRYLRAGFTLVELVAVIAIIGILAAIVTTGYVVYLRNAQKTQIATTVTAYQSAAKSAIFEDNTPITDSTNPRGCISSNAARCCVAVPPSQFSCAKNGEGSFSASIYTQFQRYLPNDKPNISRIKNPSADACSSAYTNGSEPCNTQEIGYVANYNGVTKGAIVYYLPVDYDCESKDVLVYNTGTSSYQFDSSAKFSNRKTSGKTYTECVIGIR